MNSAQRHAPGTKVILGVRPENLTIASHGCAVRLEHVEDMGSQKVLYCRSGDQELRVLADADTTALAGGEVCLGLG